MDRNVMITTGLMIRFKMPVTTRVEMERYMYFKWYSESIIHVFENKLQVFLS